MSLRDATIHSPHDDDHGRERPPLAAPSSELCPRIYRYSSPDVKAKPQHRLGTPTSQLQLLYASPNCNSASFRVDATCSGSYAVHTTSSSTTMESLPPVSPSSSSMYNGGKMYRRSVQYQLERKERKQRQLDDNTSEGLPRPQSTSCLGLLPVVKSSSSLGTSASAPAGAANHLETPYDYSKGANEGTSFKPPSARSTQRLQHGLEKSYPLYRMDAKKKEGRFLLLAKKAEKYSKIHRGIRGSSHTSFDNDNFAASLPDKPHGQGHVETRTPQPLLKENAPPVVSPPVSSMVGRVQTAELGDDCTISHSGVVPRSPDQSPSKHSGGHANPTSRVSSSVGKRAEVPSKRDNLPRKPPSSSRQGARYAANNNHSMALFNIGAAAMTCILPPINEQMDLHLDNEAQNAAYRSRKASSKPVATYPKLVDGCGERKRMKATRNELLKLKEELRFRKQLQERREREKILLEGTAKAVRFSDPLVTDIRHRPYTRPEEREKLYFVEEELDELEWDRATVEGDQFELAIDSSRVGSGADMSVSVTYMNKRNLLQGHLEEGGDGIPFSPSDLSAYYELHAS